MTEFHSPTPLYHRIYSVMRERITNGYYAPHQLMPTEAELSETFSTSRITARKAMEMLAQEGLVTRSRGRGTFVTETAMTQDIGASVVTDVSGLLSYLNKVGQGTAVRVISLDRGEAPPRIASMLALPSTTELVRAVRVRWLGEQPYSLSMTYLLPEIGAGLSREDLASADMIDLVQREGASVEQVEQTMSATLADDVSAQALGVPVGAPLMRVIRIFYDAKMQPFYAAEILYRAERYQYRLSLKRNADNDLMLDDSPSQPQP